MSGEGIDDSIRAIERATGALATASVARMDDVLPWFRGLPADQRSWVTLVAQAGVASFVAWLREPDKQRPHELADEIFDAAPRTLARSISLQHTVQLIKVTIDVVEEQVARLSAAGQEQEVGEAILRFSREVAFSAARVYARAAESRGTWDARLQAQLVDALLRGDAPDELASRAAALGWDERSPVAVAVGRSPGGDAPAVLHTVHRLARRMGVDVLGGVHGTRLVLVLGGAEDPLAATEKLAAAFGDGPVVVGQGVPTLDEAVESARAALAGYPGGAGLAGCAEAGVGGRPTARAGAGGRLRGAPGAPPRHLWSVGTGGRRAAGDPGRVRQRRRCARKRGPGAVRASEHGALPAAPCGRGHPAVPAAAAGYVHVANRADGGPP